MTENVYGQGSQLEQLRGGLRLISSLPPEKIEPQLRSLTERIGIAMRDSIGNPTLVAEQMYGEVIRAFPEKSRMLEIYLEKNSMPLAAKAFRNAENDIARQSQSRSNGNGLSKTPQALRR